MVVWTKVAKATFEYGWKVELVGADGTGMFRRTQVRG